MLRKLLHSFLIAIDAISHNKLRAFLTSLGIIFGVASVIAMLAIGKGAEKAILEQMKLLGANNIIITPDVNQKEGEISREDDRMAEKKPFSPGLTMEDASSISDNIPHVLYTSSEIELESMFIRAGLKRTGNLVGVDSIFWKTKILPSHSGIVFLHTILTIPHQCALSETVSALNFLPEKIQSGKGSNAGKTGSRLWEY